ncbi:MAG: FadD3 family acyl-CoA ligase [Acidimicrobiales bacterium]
MVIESQPWPSIPAMLAATVARFGDRPALVDGSVEHSWAQLQEAAGEVAAALVATGVEPGDRVGIWAPNGAEWVTAVLGLLAAGAVLVPVNTRFKGAEAAELLRRGRVGVLVTTSGFLGNDYLALLEDAGVALPDLRTVVVTGGRPGTAPSGSWAVVGWDELLDAAAPAARAEAARRARSLGGEDRSDILFTSGTTGSPKGVVMTHRRTLAVATDWAAMTGLGPDDRYLMVNPYFHMFGLKAGILACVAAGATMLPQPVFDVDRVLARVADERVTVLPGPPTLYQSLLDHPGRSDHDLSSLRVAVTGAADIPVALVRRIHDELPFRLVVTGYGLTEAGTAFATGEADDVETVATTVGRPRPGFELRIVDGSGREVAPGEAGEVVLRGPSVMVGYLDDAEATAAALADDGWLRTGDLGTVDPSGCLRIVGRVKDMFIVGGFNAYPAEIENALLRHPDVAQAAVVGIPDERLGEVGMAFLVLRRGATLTPASVVDWCRGQMANYKVPRAVELVDALPVNATGKVEKEVLRQRARSAPRRSEVAGA